MKRPSSGDKYATGPNLMLMLTGQTSDTGIIHNTLCLTSPQAPISAIFPYRGDYVRGIPYQPQPGRISDGLVVRRISQGCSIPLYKPLGFQTVAR